MLSCSSHYPPLQKWSPLVPANVDKIHPGALLLAALQGKGHVT